MEQEQDKQKKKYCSFHSLQSAHGAIKKKEVRGGYVNVGGGSDARYK